MRLSMDERRVLVKAFAQRYQKGSKKVRSEVLDAVVAATGYSRAYARWLLRWHGRRVWVGKRLVVVGDAAPKVRRRRRRVYDDAVVVALKRLWALLDYPSGKRLAPALGPLIDALERHGELTLGSQVRAKLLRISAATIDRLLRPEKQRYALKLKSRARTKPGTLLRQQVPVRTFAEWDEVQPGFAELDLVAHDGGCARGDFVQTLTLTDIATTWTELCACRNKAQVWVFVALQQVRARLPFPLRGIHSDNGVEFLNRHLVAYCSEQHITFTRSRPNRKNDNCFVEKKNWSVARRFIGYARFDTDAACRVLAQLEEVLSDYVNYFVPSMKLVAKVRDGAKVSKRYDRAQTPLERVLASPHISDEIKQALRQRAVTLNPAALWRAIRRLQRQLQRLATPTPETHPPTRAVDGAGLRKAGPHPPTPTFPQPLEIAHGAISTPPTAPAARKEISHALT